MNLESLADDISEQHDIEPAWVKAIISHESHWKSWASRYEANYLWTYKPEVFAKNPLISFATELTHQKTSWGLGQVMGALAREQGHTGFLTELIKPEINIKHMCIRIQFLKKYSDEPDAVFSMYNGGPGALKKKDKDYPNQTYVDSVLRHLQKYNK